MDSSLFTIWTICRNTISAWIRHPSYILAALIPCLAFLLVEFLASTVVSHSPIALVTLDHRPLGQKMQYIFHQADVFRITDATPQQAQELYNNIQVAAIITIPADFTQRVEAHEPSPVDVTINNLNLDFTNDIRRSVPDAITQFYQTQGSKSVIKVGMDVHNLRIHDIELFQYSVLPTIILLLTINGLVNASVSIAREFESQSIKELLLSPASNTAIALGKILAFFLIAFFTGVFGLLLGIALEWIQPAGWQGWLVALSTMGLVALFAASVGFIFGAWTQRIQSGHALATNFSIFFFFLAGGIGVLAFMPQWLQSIAAFIPLSYGRHALEMALFYNSSDLLARDFIVLGISALVPLGFATRMVRR